MEHDIYYERQRALIERSLRSQEEDRKLDEAIRKYRHAVATAKAYRRLQRTGRHDVVRAAKGDRPIKRQHTSMNKCERQVYRTRRFDNSYITVYCKGRPTL